MGKDTINSITVKATKFIYLSDIHFGVRQNTEEWQDNQRQYFNNWFIPFVKNYISANPEEKVVCMVLGDVYDDRKSIDINVNNLAIDVFLDISQILPVYIINGNHDLSKKTNRGNTSLRSIDLIQNVTLVREPTILKVVGADGKKRCGVIAIPYLGSTVDETEYLVKYSGKADVALMHTELAKMKMDNGMTITNGANPDSFKGKIIAGHIHRRQEKDRVVYVGSPYQMSKGDIGNEKGVYVMDTKTLDMEFTPNKFSPIFHTIHIEDYLELGVQQRQAFMNNNYNFIVVEEKDLPKYKKDGVDIYNLGEGTGARSAKPIVNRVKHDVGVEDGKEYAELTMDELICESIDQLDVDDAAKGRLKDMSTMYLKIAEAQFEADA